MSEHSVNILVIESNPTLRGELILVLRGAGFSVADVADYLEALTKLEEVSVDVAIVDEVLPKIDGKYACSHLHGIFDIPVILVGKESTGEACKAAFKAGADFYFTEPFPHQELVARVKAMLHHINKKSA